MCDAVPVQPLSLCTTVCTKANYSVCEFLHVIVDQVYI